MSGNIMNIILSLTYLPKYGWGPPIPHLVEYVYKILAVVAFRIMRSLLRTLGKF